MSATFRKLAAVAAAAALLLPLSPANADPTPTTPDLGKAPDKVAKKELTARFATTGKWFVELKSEPIISGGRSTTIRREQEKFLSDAKAQGIPASASKAYSKLFNGFVVDTTAKTASDYLDFEGVEAVYPVLPVSMPKPEQVKPDLYSAIKMTGADIVQSELGFDGKGIQVGIIDSGVDYDHPDLGGTGKNGGPFPTARVTKGWDFVGDAYNADPNSPTYNPKPSPDAFPDDCQGHGTHVAGIVGAKGKVTGVAPGVTFGAYRVFGCNGSTDTQIILDALERAQDDGMNVINLSLGAAFVSWPGYPTGKASDRLVNAGIVVVGSAGNEGDYFTQAVGSPAAAKKVIGVASYDNTDVLLSELLVTDDPGQSVSAGYLPATGSPEPTSALSGTPIKSMADPLGCTAEPGSLAGAIAFVNRGTCSFFDKALNAQNSGAKALIIANNAAGFINATVEGDTKITIPVVTVTQAQGGQIAGFLTDDATVPTAAFTGEKTSQPNPTGGLISDFSSWGLDADLTLKPDLGAPGGSIYSTLPLEKKGYGAMSGTSMAAPHVAGAVALMLQADPSLKPAKVLERLQNTATPTVFSYAADSGILDAAHHQGAGLIHVDKAIQATTTVSPGKISTGESADGPFTQRLTVTNASAAPITYTMSAQDAVSTYVDPKDPTATQNKVTFKLWSSKVSFSAESITVPAGGSATVDVTIDADPAAIEGSQYSGFVKLTPGEGAEPISVPFAGMAGDYGNLKIFPDLNKGLPGMVVIDKCNAWEDQNCVDNKPEYSPAPAKRVYQLGKDLPTAVMHIAVPVKKMDVYALRVDGTGKPIEASKTLAYTVDNVGRGSSLSLWSWDGRLKNASGLFQEVAPGNYVLRFVALEPDGDGGTQTWTSGVFGIKNVPKPTPKPTPTPKPGPKNDLYTTPGYHTVNGREWFTQCEPYSKTTRCRTSILATQVVFEGGKFYQRRLWAFNNLTYLPQLTRAQWAGNPLAVNKAWTDASGRQWRTECDTAVTGRNGCRTYVMSQVIEAAPGGGYRWVSKWVFNNMVRFKP